MKLEPDISVVLVTYNRARFLPRTLDSIHAQTFANYELLICDDCSTDSTREICRAYAARDSRIHYYRNKVNIRMPANLNAGLERARCELVANLHDGDIYHPTLLEKWHNALVAYPSAGFVFNKYRHLDDAGNAALVVNNFPELIPGHKFLEYCFRGRDLESPVWGTVMARRSIYQKFDYFDTRYSFWADFDMWFRIAEEHDVAFVNESLIDLPSKKVMPHLFRLNAFEPHLQMFRAFWAARCRHYRGSRRQLTRELAKQTYDFAVSRAGRVAARLR
ncbi:MAG TPA: glycosyltransferase family A protein [Bryobacteraceae bacterium]